MSTYDTLKTLPGFGTLSDSAKHFLKTEADVGEIRICNVCHRFMPKELIHDESDSADYCSKACIETTGYTEKDLLQDYYLAPAEGEDGYSEMIRAKESLDDVEFAEWLTKRYNENIDAPVYWTEACYDREAEGAKEAIQWLENVSLEGLV